MANFQIDTEMLKACKDEAAKVNKLFFGGGANHRLSQCIPFLDKGLYIKLCVRMKSAITWRIYCGGKMVQALVCFYECSLLEFCLNCM